MSRVTLLHLSDLHYDPVNHDQSIVLGALFNDLRTSSAAPDTRPDLIVFSGDLVQAGENEDLFARAYAQFIVPALDCTSLDPEHFFIVPGNHDVDRRAVRSAPFVELGLQQHLDSTSSANRFIDDYLSNTGRDEYKIALSRLSAYHRHTATWFARQNPLDTVFVNVHRLTVNGISVSVACLNTAWRATGELALHDYGKLILGKRVVDRAVEHSQDAELRIAVLHHPLSWLSPFDRASVEARLYSCFHVLLCGHLHSTTPQARMNPYGASVISQVGCLYHSRDYCNGYALLTIDLTHRVAKFRSRSYQDRRRSFDAALDVAPNGANEFPLAMTASDFIGGISSVISAARAVIRARANHHIAMLTGDAENTYDIKEFFVCPPLATSPEYHSAPLATSSSKGHSDTITLPAMLESSANWFIRGKRESGKTSLCHYIAVLASEGTCDKPRVPIIFDFPLEAGS